MAGGAAVARGAGGALCAGASFVTVDVLTGHICSVSLCLYVPTERDKYVWLVQSRRRPVDRDLEGGLTSQWNAGPGFLIMCCVWESLSQDDDGGLLRSRWTCSRSGRSARRAGPNAAGVLVILSKHTFHTRFHLSLCQRYCEQVRLEHLTVIAVLVPQIREQIIDVIKVIPEEWMSKQIVQQIVDVPASKILVKIVEPVAYRRQATALVDVHFPVPQIQEKIVEVIKVILREQCQRVRFFSFDSVWRGAVGCTQRASAAPQPTPTREV